MAGLRAEPTLDRALVVLLYFAAGLNVRERHQKPAPRNRKFSVFCAALPAVTLERATARGVDDEDRSHSAGWRAKRTRARRHADAGTHAVDKRGRAHGPLERSA